MKKPLLSLLLLLGLVVPGFVLEAQPAAPAPPAVVNGDFETGAPGEVPPGWAVTEGSAGRGYVGRTVEEKPAAGKRAAVLESTRELPGYEARGALRQTLDATSLRGKRVRFSGVTRVDRMGQGGFIGSLLRIGFEGPGASRSDAASEPVTTADWGAAQVLAEVPADATQIYLYLHLTGPGKAYFDGLSLAVVGLAGEGNEAARALSPRGLDNLIAFTRLLGYVRHFHPSDQAAAADWARVARIGVARVEKAADARELARALEEVFRPLAPTLRVVAGKERPGLPPGLTAEGATEIIAWDHQGVALSQRTDIYQSQRVSWPLAQPGPPKKEGDTANPTFPKPGEPLFAELGGGVWALVPLALYKDAAGTLPRVTGAADAALPSDGKPDGFVASGNDRTTRLADVALAWNVFQHFYPYFDVVGTDWPAELKKALTTAAADKDEAAFLVTLKRLVAALHDGHGGVYHPSEALTHSLPLLWVEIGGQLVVSRIAPEVQGIELGDLVLRLNGRPAGELFAERLALTSGATRQWSAWRAANELLSGPQGEKVTLEVEHARGGRATVTLERSVAGVGMLTRKDPEKIAEIRPGIFYVDLDRITEDDFKGAVERLAAAKGVIFDLRGYPANVSPVVLEHLTDKDMTCARWLVPRVTFPDRKDMGFDFSNWPVPATAPRLQGKVAFLINGRAISYAETYMGIVENYHLAEIVGTPTAGTNGNINPFSLPGGYSIVWTGMKVLKHDGARHHGVGIQPTVPVEPTRQGIAEGRDEVLEKAIEVVGR